MGGAYRNRAALGEAAPSQDSGQAQEDNHARERQQMRRPQRDPAAAGEHYLGGAVGRDHAPDDHRDADGRAGHQADMAASTASRMSVSR
ncbi:MAG: hypothetical protein ACRDRH_14455 [Pseudonocardia sp.]